jgi:hypothetical protein
VCYSSLKSIILCFFETSFISTARVHISKECACLVILLSKRNIIIIFRHKIYLNWQKFHVMLEILSMKNFDNNAFSFIRVGIFLFMFLSMICEQIIKSDFFLIVLRAVLWNLFTFTSFPQSIHILALIWIIINFILEIYENKKIDLFLQ